MPITSESHTFESFDGLTIRYQEWGVPDGRSPVLLHHGFAVDADLNWVATGVVAALVADGRHVLALDARGHGRSSHPHESHWYGEANMAQDLRQLVDLTGADEVHLAGYSMGAIVALLASVADPRITRLVIGGVGAGVPELGGVDTRVVPIDALRAALLTDDPDAATLPAARSFRQAADAFGADRFALAAQAAVVHAEPIPLAQVTAATLVIAGDADELATRPEVLAAAIPGAELRMIPGDHLGAVVDPAFAPALVGFLGDRAVPATHDG